MLPYRPSVPSPSLRDFLNPTRYKTIILIVILSFTYVCIVLSGRSWNLVFLSQDADLVFEPNESQPGELRPVRYRSAVYHPFRVPTIETSLANQTVRPIKAHSALSRECLDRWVSTGQWQEPCRHSMVQDSKIDLVYIWVNGSDPLHFASRNTTLHDTNGYRTSEARFREHGELRYSIRAAQRATATWPDVTTHIVTADVPAPNNDTYRLGLVPQWLDPTCASYTFSPQIDQEVTVQQGQSPIRLHHDTQLFRYTADPGSLLQPQDAALWLSNVLPSFNSMAVESQLAHLNPDVVSENIIALNDDQFLMLPAPPSAFHSTLYGPVFRIQDNLMVDGNDRGMADGNGEWRSLRWSAQVLDKRFGTRRRPYVQHNARALSLPLMHEAALTFGSEFANTPLSHFRGSHDVSGEYEINTIFLASHFVIERHREALLWSWVIGKWGSRTNGVFDKRVKAEMWADLGGQQQMDDLVFQAPERATKDHVDLNMLIAGIQPPEAIEPDKQMHTLYSWVSMDGYTSDYKNFPMKTTHRRSACLGTEPEDAWAVFIRLLMGQCGDYVITSLTRKSTSGLSAFLPDHTEAKESPEDPVTLPLELPNQMPRLPSNPRAFATRIIQRYAYVIGDSPTVFMSMKGVLGAQRILERVDRERKTALFCLNDDLSSNQKVLGDTDTLLRRWFDGRWPDKLHCETGR
ncbi:unnamed protein product [Mycena citricolor]|uniref:Stealth protein CR1 conserved region 1 domain-containing protein n=1 Tax=Mycena citricolor TaxID=2018698 RepID=A0AAD2Q464_9AGAR|nr:unnamed protein product [Mycena citricolor]